MKKKKVLIIGGYGFFGLWLTKSLSKENFEISILDPKLNQKILKKYKIKHYFKFSTTNYKKLKNAIDKDNWDYIINLSAWGGTGNGLLKAADENFEKALYVNVKAFRNLLEEIKNSSKIKVIWSSSTVVFGEESYYKYKKVNEKSELNPKTNYGLTKVLAEKITKYYIKNYKMNIIGIRFPIIVGPGLNYRGVAAGISDMALFSKKRKPITIAMVSSSLDLIYIKDAVSIIIKIMNSNSKLKCIYNCPSYRTNAKKISDSFNSENNKKYISLKSLNTGATYPIMKSNLIKNDIKFSLSYDLSKTIKDWLKEL